MAEVYNVTVGSILQEMAAERGTTVVYGTAGSATTWDPNKFFVTASATDLSFITTEVEEPELSNTQKWKLAHGR